MLQSDAYWPGSSYESYSGYEQMRNEGVINRRII